MKNKEKTCQNCHAFDFENLNCHRFPPANGTFPMVGPHDWCMAWKAKPKPREGEFIDLGGRLGNKGGRPAKRDRAAIESALLSGVLSESEELGFNAISRALKHVNLSVSDGRLSVIVKALCASGKMIKTVNGKYLKKKD